MSEDEKEKKPVLIEGVPVQVKATDTVFEFVEDGLRERAIIPTRALAVDADTDSFRVDARLLAKAARVGVAWEKVELQTPSAKAIANALREAGIWTKDDLYRSPNTVIAVLQGLYRADLSALLAFADKE